MPDYESIVILTGAGISAESGVPTCRDKSGIWAVNTEEDYHETRQERRDAGQHADRGRLRRARRRGLRTMTGFVLAANTTMLHFARQLGFTARHDPDERDTIRVERTL